MDILSQYLNDCQVNQQQDSNHKTKLAALVGSMTRDELEMVKSAAVFTPDEVTELPEGELSEDLLVKVAFIMSVGANERISPEMVKEAGVWSEALKPYLGKGLRALKALVTGKSGKAVVDRTKALKGMGKRIQRSYRTGSASGGNMLTKAFHGAKAAVKDNPALGVAGGGALAGLGGAKLLFGRKKQQPAYAKYASKAK